VHIEVFGRTESGSPHNGEPPPMIDRDAVAAGLLSGLPPGVSVLAFDTEIRFVAVHGEGLRKAGWRDEEIVGRTAPELLLGVPDGDLLLDAYRGALHGGRSRVRVAGAARAWQVDVSPLRHAQGHIIGGLVVGMDVTARQQARRLHDARARAAELIATARDDLPERLVCEVAPMLLCHAAVYWEPAEDGGLRATASWIKDRDAHAAVALAAGTPTGELAPGSGLVGQAFASGRWHAITDLEHAERTPWVRAALTAGTRSASAVPALGGGSPMGVFEFLGPVPIEDDPDVAAALTRLVEEVAHAWERRRQTETLQTLADHDSLTGLLNRRRFEEELHTQAAAVARYHRHAALLVFDLDGFKGVNDAHGHAVGDALLRAIAGVLHRRLRASDRAARLGGDEFAVILDDADPAVATQVAAGLVRDLAAIRLDDHPDVRAAASVGVAAITGDDGLSALRIADHAMYAEKRRRR
jgi:diguanylate cyclase (GGDEF)-like protein/PAS domain S-box-containing protein